MKMNFWERMVGVICVACGFGLLALSGCSQQEAADTIKKSEDAVEQAAKSVSDGASEMVEKGKDMAGDMADKGKEMASKLSEEAQAYLNPLKEKFGNLDGLKEKPEELKNALTDLVQSMEKKAANVQLPASISDALSAVKEKIEGLIQYLEGEYEQSEINKKLSEIMESIKSGLGM